jgi:hypothetical protein
VLVLRKRLDPRKRKRKKSEKKNSYSLNEGKGKELVWHQCATAEMSGVLVLQIRAFAPYFLSPAVQLCLPCAHPLQSELQGVYR